MKISILKPAVLAVSALLLASAFVSQGAAEIKKGSAFPKLADFKLEGAVPDLAGKVVIIDFWASWCGPCKKAMPALKDLHETYKDRGVVIIGLSLDQDKGDMDAYLAKNPMPFAILRDAKGAFAEKVGVESIPATFVIGADGLVLQSHSGFAPGMKAEIAKVLEANLKAKN